MDERLSGSASLHEERGGEKAPRERRDAEVPGSSTRARTITETNEMTWLPPYPTATQPELPE